MKKKFIVLFALLLCIVGSGVAFAASNTSQPAKPIVCTLNPADCTGNVVQPAATAYLQVLKEAGYGQDECYADGSLGVGVSCDTGLKPPPVGGHCNGVNGGGMLSPVYKEADINNGFGLEKQYLFKSLDCYALWGAIDDVTGTHTVTSVTLTDTTTSRVETAFLAPRTTNPGDWTSTFMMSFVPGDSYTVDVQTDGVDQIVYYP